jgi:predicted 2-oxoglutarate/Fe(II)-dependent dioxygenase YbiX
MSAVTLRPGDKLPFCYGMDEAQRYWSFEDQAGRAGVLLVAGSAPPSELADVAERLAKLGETIASAGAQVRVLVQAGAAGWRSASPPGGIGLAHVVDPRLFEAVDAPAVVVCDRAMRFVARFDLARVLKAPDALLACLYALPREAAQEVRTPAPVLITPGVLDRETCARLIARFEGGEHVEGAMASVDADGAAINRVDAAKKRRRDLTLDPAEPLFAEVVGALSSRLVPEIRKAFQVQVAHLDRVLIARYDDTGGYFRRHRDNSSAHLAYREFALSLNLNTDEYEGGELVFPEFNDHRHNPPAGAGAVFSASLLHEALPVTRGARYVLLTFLHSDAAEARRQASEGVAAAS